MILISEQPVLGFIIKDLPSLLILVLSAQMLNDSLCCSYKYKWIVM